MTKPVLSDPIALRLPVDLLAEIEKIAEVSERTRSWVMVRAMRLYLAGEGRDVLAVAQAQQQVDRGEFQDMDALLNELDGLNREHVA